VSLGFARIEGPVTSYVGINRWGGLNHEYPAQFEGKTFALLSVDSVMYTWVGPSSGPASYSESRLCYSLDHSASWTPVDWAFTIDDGIVFPAYLNFGRGYEGARDNYLYTYFIELMDASDLLIQIPGQIQLARVPKDQVLLRKSYEFFAGRDSVGDPTWSYLLEERMPVFQDPRGVGWAASVSFNPGIGRYFLCTEHDSSGVGNLGMFDAPEPWGPWTTVTYVTAWEGYGEVFYWNFSNKWLSPDGRDFTMIYSGDRHEDAWHHVRGSFVVDENPLEAGVITDPNGLGLRVWQEGDLVVFRVGLPSDRARGPFRLDLFDVAGRHVSRISNGAVPTGHLDIRWRPSSASGSPLAPAVYYVRLTASDREVATGRVPIR
jgi:hypothetical protein